LSGTVSEVLSQGAKFFLQPTDPDAEDKSPARKDVQRRDNFRGDKRVAVRNDDHASPEFYGFCHRSGIAKYSERFKQRIGRIKGQLAIWGIRIR
jgi:hypothetical protein